MATQMTSPTTAIIAADPSAHARSTTAKELGDFIAAEWKGVFVKLASLKPYVEVAFERLDVGNPTPQQASEKRLRFELKSFTALLVVRCLRK